MPRNLLAALAFVGLTACASSHGSRLEIPDFDHLASQATEAVDVKLGPVPLALTRWASRWALEGDDPEDDALRETLKGLKFIHVRHYEFATDFAYPKAEIDAFRARLARKGWSPLAQVRNRDENGDVDVYVALDEDRITGLVIVATEPREFTIVNIEGSVDIANIDGLHGEIHVRRSGSSTRERDPSLL